MLKYGKDIGLPETYRITLALSIAFLAHTLLVAVFPFDLPEHHHNPVTVEVRLTPLGSTPSREQAASRAEAAPIATPFAIDEPAPESSEPETVSTVQDQAPITPEPTSDPLSSPTESSNARTQPRRETSSSISALASTLSAAGGPQQPTEAAEPERVTQRSTKPTEETAYRALLARNISENGGVSVKEFLTLDIKEGEARTVWLQLRLMGNGTLIDARVSQPSGNKKLDLLAYKAALYANPYPEPPDALKRQRWFSVELKTGDF
ncbi:TonB C-terminal domain-containing protein [Marinobacter sp. CHS3-4]|uniref:TonB C-terminal domain-containing protein n=1 Tax=Marinobacter sp. CHS3-4 TaxID=3045174 RepID=UPI0024B57BF1|nr:TonB C-terminal domain-containing protein [Marinobacter sp. CHS3-4]MDI9246150.1 TonB C-terminal domain-containing protein [Marinobacter sp. CHS3-4]